MFESLIWFVFGALVSVFVSRVINIFHGITVLNEINKSAILLLTRIEQNANFILEEKYKECKKIHSIEEYCNIKEYDKNMVLKWKNENIETFFNSYPKRLHKILKFSNWEEAKKWAL